MLNCCWVFRKQKHISIYFSWRSMCFCVVYGLEHFSLENRVEIWCFRLELRIFLWLGYRSLYYVQIWRRALIWSEMSKSFLGPFAQPHLEIQQELSAPPHTLFTELYLTTKFLSDCLSSSPWWSPFLRIHFSTFWLKRIMERLTWHHGLEW